MDTNDLATQLSAKEDFIAGSMSLYDGRLVKTETELLFIAERFGGWEIMEQCSLKDVEKVEVNESFMGRVIEIHTSGTHWSLKDVDDSVDVEGWIKGTFSEQSSSSVQESNPEEQNIEHSVPSVPDEIENTKLEPAQPSEVSPPSPPKSTEPIESDSELPEVLPEDIEKLRTLLNVKPMKQNLVENFLGEQYDGSDGQIIRILQKNPQLLSKLRNIDGVFFTIIKTIFGFQGADAGSLVKKAGIGIFLFFFVMPFVMSFVLIFVRACVEIF